MVAALVIAVIVAAFVATPVFWDLLGGIALFGVLGGIVTFDLSMILTSLLLLGGCVWHWGRWA